VYPLVVTSTAIRPHATLVRSVALPAEHGGWSFLLEPVLLGLLVAFSWPAVLVALAALGLFLAHQPLKTAIKDARAGRRAPRTVLAERFAAAYLVLAAAAVAGLLPSVDLRLAGVLLASIPFAAVQLAFDARNRSRTFTAEACGAAALAAIAPAMAALAGWNASAMLGLWLVLVARGVPSVVYVRARLGLEHGKRVSTIPTLVAHAVAILAIGAAAWSGLAPWLAVAAMVALLARAAFGLSPYRVGRRPAAIGAQEIAFGLVAVAAAAVGYARM
jgi:hypothetical protein